ncbi:hypothetical protein ACWFRB_03090 [Rhodococcus sp. NPDC055112]
MRALFVAGGRLLGRGHDWLAEHGVRVTALDDARCADMMTRFISKRPALWDGDTGVAE